MIVSEAQILANRPSSQTSTGPKTTEVQDRSRAHALKRWLCSSEVVPESAELIQQRSTDWYYTLKPQNDLHGWLVDQIALLSIRINRCERMERRIRDKVSLQAELGWDDDRRSEAEALGSTISRRPAETLAQLRRTSHGCEWLMTRWAMLARSADLQGAWTPDQSRLAFDLLGTPVEFRIGKPGEAIDLDGLLISSADDPAAVARREVAALRQRHERMTDLDEVHRTLAEADLSDDISPELRRLRRHEGTLHNRLRWCMSQLQFQSPHFKPHPDVKPQWLPAEPEIRTEPEPEIQPEPESARRREVWQMVPPHPPFDLEPHEFPQPGEEVNIPAIVAARHQRKLARVEARREARRRKLETVRA